MGWPPAASVMPASLRVTSTGAVQAIASQRDAHRRSPSRMVEVPESIEIRFEQKLARAVVFWKLTAGARVENGALRVKFVPNQEEDQ